MRASDSVYLYVDPPNAKRRYSKEVTIKEEKQPMKENRGEKERRNRKEKKKRHEEWKREGTQIVLFLTVSPSLLSS